MDHASVTMAALFLVLGFSVPGAMAGHEYGEALTKSILFFEAQRSGYLLSSQRVEWRGDSGLSDGKINGVDLVGGYYDAGDNVKFGLPMAFTVTMMCWSIIEYGRQIDGSGELQHAIDAVKWGTDYFIKAHPQPYVLYGQVGDGDTDHDCWQRPEDMTTSRAAYKIDADHPGSDLAGETAAAMAAASIVFRSVNSSYSAELLKHAEQLFEFADKYRGKYDSSISVAQEYYRSVSGYEDELLWGAAWLYKATNKEYYLNYLGDNGDALGGTGWAVTEFGWDIKYAGVQTLVAKFLMAGKGGKHTQVFQRYQEKAEFFMCSCNAGTTPGGLIFRQRWNNMQFVTTASFLMAVYSDYLASASKSLTCAHAPVSPPQLLALAKSQVDYILGDNPRATSYMVGYGKKYPQQVHHRASSIVSYKVDPSFVSCRGGYTHWFNRKAGDPNILTGAVVGGPDAYDNFADHRDNYEQTEAATYNTAPLIGVLARLHAGHGGYNQLLSVELPLLNKPVQASPKPSVIISIEQKVTTSWIERGKRYYRYSATVTNKSSKKMMNLKLQIMNLYGPLWGLTKSGDYYFFPHWIHSLGAGKGLEFVYIHSASQAHISLSTYTLDLVGTWKQSNDAENRVLSTIKKGNDNKSEKNKTEYTVYSLLKDLVSTEASSVFSVSHSDLLPSRKSDVIEKRNEGSSGSSLVLSVHSRSLAKNSSKSRRNDIKKKKNGKGENKGKKNNKKEKCFKCGKKGHWKVNCPSLVTKGQGNQAKGLKMMGLPSPRLMLEVATSTDGDFTLSLC